MNRTDGFLNQNDDLDIKDIMDKYDNISGMNNTDTTEIWSEPLEENFSVPKNPFIDKNKKTPINLHIEDEYQDTPGDFLKNNQTIKLDAPANKKINNVWNKANIEDQWSKSESIQNNENNQNEPNILFTERFQPSTKTTKKLRTITLQQPGLDFENDIVKPIKVPTSIEKINKNFSDAEPSRFDYNALSKHANIPASTIIEKETTRILFDDNLANERKPDLTREINDGEHITIKPKQQKQVSAKKIAKMKQKQLRKEQYKQVPKFFKFEYRNAKVSLTLSSIIFAGVLGLLGYVIFYTIGGALNYWLLLPVSLGILFAGCLFTKATLDYSYLHKDLKNNQYQIDKLTPLTSVRKMYKKLLGANISLNWISAAMYVLCGLSVLLTYLITYFINLTALEFNDFTRLIIGSNNYLPVYFVWSFAGFAGLTLIIQVIYNFVNRKRRNEIELFHTTPIIDEQAVLKIKKNANVKGAIIFSLSVLVLGFVVMMTYLILRRKKLARV